jgi:hypothetical protein
MKEALKLALEALKNLVYRGEWHDQAGYQAFKNAEQAITAIKEALTQPEQEPVAYWIPKAEQFCFASPTGRPFAKAWEPLYTSPPQRQPLTDEEIAEVAERMEATDAASSFWREFARAIEAKLKEKNHD